MRQTTAGKVRRIAPAALGLAFFAIMAALYASGHKPLYDRVIRAWGVDPFAFPFLDTDTVWSALVCLRRGVDVFVANPCDVLGRVYDYSPLWLLLARLPVTHGWLVPAGLTVDLAFLASLLLLPPGRSGAETGRILLGVIAPAVMFAVERGNNDLVLFTLAAIAATLMTRSPALRLVGYGAALLAGLLKYYPMTLMALATRERPARFLAVAAASIVAVALFLVTMGHDLVRALALIPVGAWSGDMFGSSTLPYGIADMAGLGQHGATALRLLFSLAALVVGARLGLAARTGAALDRLTEAERSFLLAGGLLVIGCFFTAQNIGYRATHLVLLLPGLTALWRTTGSRLWPAATYAAIALLWSQCWRGVLYGLAHERPWGLLSGWALREALWWGEITVVIALVAGLLARSTMGRTVLGPALTNKNI